MATKEKEKAVEKVTGKGKAVTKSDARATQVRAKIQDLRSSIEENYLELAESLHEVHSKEYFLEYGFKTFAEYAEVELETKYRRAMYFVDIWNRTKDLKISKSKLKKIGWTKAKEIVGAMTEDNADELIELAAEKTSTELKEEMIKRGDSKAGTRGAAERLSYQRMSLKMSTSEADVITSAMEEAKKAIDSDNDVAALEHICMEWMQQNDEASPPSLDSVIKYASTVFGVTLVESGKKSKAKVEEKAAPKAKEKVKAKKEPEPEPEEEEIDLDEVITSWSSATKFCKEHDLDLKFSRTDTVKKMKAAIQKALESSEEEGEGEEEDEDEAPPPKASTKKVEKKAPPKAAPKKTTKKEEPEEDADEEAGDDGEDINALLGIK